MSCELGRELAGRREQGEPGSQIMEQWMYQKRRCMERTDNQPELSKAVDYAVEV